jgi:hypothetical protein
MGMAWLAAALSLVIAGLMLARAARGWWIVSAVAAAISQAVILSSWTDAKAGTAVNVIILVAAGYGLAAHGPKSYRAQYRRRIEVALTDPVPAGIISDADLAVLPAPVAAYVRHCGAVGEARVVNFRARIHGRIRAGASKPWMSFTGEQVNTYGSAPSRVFLMDATMFGLPLDVLHVFVGPSATVRVTLCSLLPMVNAAGPDMDRGETVTLFNDLCVLAPAALIDAPVTWKSIDPHRVRAEFTNGAHTVSAELVFDDEHELIDFVSDDRSRASADGRHFTPQRWSTPLSAYRDIGGRRIATYGEARWHAPDPEGEFSYLELHVDEVVYNTGTAQVHPLSDTTAAARRAAQPANYAIRAVDTVPLLHDARGRDRRRPARAIGEDTEPPMHDPAQVPPLTCRSASGRCDPIERTRRASGSTGVCSHGRWARRVSD